jgi:hypothetical protein
MLSDSFPVAVEPRKAVSRKAAKNAKQNQQLVSDRLSVPVVF